MTMEVYLAIIEGDSGTRDANISVFDNYDAAVKYIESCVSGQKYIEGENNLTVKYIDCGKESVFIDGWIMCGKPLYYVEVWNTFGGRQYVTKRFIVRKEVNKGF